MAYPVAVSAVEKCEICNFKIDHSGSTAIQLKGKYQYVHDDCLNPWLHVFADIASLLKTIPSINGNKMANPVAAAELITCSICLSDIAPESTVSKLNCNHQFHRDCLKPWLDKHNTCPLDRSRVTSINGEPLDRPNALLSGNLIQDPLREARALLQQGRVIRNPSIHSRDPIEQTAAKTQQVFFSLFGRPAPR